MALHWYEQIMETGKTRLFKSYRPDFEDGKQRRDFISVDDVVKTLWDSCFRAHESVKNGVYNLGSGGTRTWLDLAHSLFNSLKVTPQIEWIEMPPGLSKRYQYFTQARMDRLHALNLGLNPISLEKGIDQYLSLLKLTS